MIDIDEGKVKVRFMAELQRDLGLAYRPEHWTEARLAAWDLAATPAGPLHDACPARMPSFPHGWGHCSSRMATIWDARTGRSFSSGN